MPWPCWENGRCGVGSGSSSPWARAEQHCSELVLMGLARARFCELLSSRLQSETDLFLMGLLSVMDAVLEVGMDVLLEQLPVERETKAALLGPEQHSRGRSTPHAGAGIRGCGRNRARLAKQLNYEDEVRISPLGLVFTALQWAQEATSGV